MTYITLPRICFFKTTWQVVILTALTLSCVSRMPACGPWYHESMLEQPKAALQAPIVNFEMEVRGMTSPSEPPAVARNIVGPDAEGDDHVRYLGSLLIEPEVKELETLVSSIPEGPRTGLLQNYQALRSAMVKKYSGSDDQDHNFRVPDGGEALLAEAEKGNWPSGLPGDIQIYLQGALQYDNGDNQGALVTWKHLLALPEAERRNRSVAAAWMIARVVKDTESLKASRPWYEQCMQMAGDGYPDCLELGLSALGWIAKTYLAGDDDGTGVRKALEMYYHQARAGDSTGWASLLRVIPDIAEIGIPAAELQRWAADPFLRGLETAWQLRQYGHWKSYDWGEMKASSAAPVSRWLGAIEQAGVKDMPEASQLAELAYTAGDFELAKRWLLRSPAGDSRALWVKGKIQLMEGDLGGAEKNLQAAVPTILDQGRLFPGIFIEGASERLPLREAMSYRTNQMLGDLGVVALSRDHYFQALSALCEGGFSDDAAYVAERVLSREELLTFVRSHYPQKLESGGDEAAYKLRYTLARRLARENYFKDAREFFPSPLLPVFDRYVSLFRRARDPSLPRATRAQALWEAAQIHRALGLEMFGTEEQPDAATYDGDLDPQPFIESRCGFSYQPPAPGEWWWDHLPKLTDFVPRPSSAERYRVKHNRLLYEKRFQYRYVAADMAWKAAGMMPDKSEETARVLGIAGSWIKDRDPQAADRFYKAMIWRNWSTPLAREADKRRWFPEMNWDYNPWAAAGVPVPKDLPFRYDW